MDKFFTLIIWILVHFQVDPYQKNSDPLVKMLIDLKENYINSRLDRNYL